MIIDPFNDEYFMKQALVEARAAADEGEVPVGAVIRPPMPKCWQ